MKLTDIEPYNGYGEPLYHRYLEFVGANYQNQSGRSDKFWEVAVFKVDKLDYLVVRRWGKYGKRGQIKGERFAWRDAAKSKARKLKAKKRKAGYTKEIDIVTRLGMQVGEEDAA